MTHIELQRYNNLVRKASNFKISLPEKKELNSLGRKKVASIIVHWDVKALKNDRENGR